MHDPRCSGCPHCDPAMAASYRELWSARMTPPVAPTHEHVLRTAASKPPVMKTFDEWIEYFVEKAMRYPEIAAEFVTLIGRPPVNDGATAREPQSEDDDPSYHPFGQPMHSYKIALARRGDVTVDVTDDPNYEPFGNPPNGYRLALARRKEQQ